MEPLESEQKPSRRLLWIGIALVVAVVVLIGTISYLMVAGTKKDTKTAASPSPSKSVASKEEIAKDIATLNDSLKQANKDQDAAKAAIKQSANQPKIGN